jgi:predicted aspartyl protease
MRGFLLLARVAIGLVFAGPAIAQSGGNCQLVKLASLDMAIDPVGRVTVPMMVNGKKENLLVDTGGVTSMLTAKAAADLGLPLRSIDESKGRFKLFGNEDIPHYVTADTIQLGGLTGQKKDFMILPDDRAVDGVDGTLSPDIMGAYDVEFDFAAAKLNLFSRDHCAGQVVYWTHQPYATIPMGLDRWGHIGFKVSLDGHSVEALMDTGAASSLARSDAVQDFVPQEEIETAEARNTRNDAVPHHLFKTLTLRDVSVLNPDIAIVSRELRGPELLLGMGILRQLHLYIAYQERNIYVTAAEAR